MWHELFALHPSVAEKVLRAVLVYAFLVIALRVGGKRELGQLSTIDFVVLLAVANAVQNGIIGTDDSVTGAVIGATTLFLVNGLVIMAVIRNRTARRLLVGHATVLVVDGQVLEDNLRKERLSREDLMQAVAEQGGGSLADVTRCAIEANGHISVTLRSADGSAELLGQVLERLAVIEKRLGQDPSRG